MKPTSRPKHFIDSIAAFLLFGFFSFFLLLLLISAAKIYTLSIQGLKENENLHTAVSYISMKFRQHDTPGGISISPIKETTSLCFTDVINDTKYQTYIYLQDHILKELFVSSDSPAPLEMGTPIAELSEFSVQELENHFYRISMTDLNGKTSKIICHAKIQGKE